MPVGDVGAQIPSSAKEIGFLQLIGVVILPQLSRFIDSKNEEKISLIQNKALELSLFLSIPATIHLMTTRPMS